MFIWAGLHFKISRVEAIDKMYKLCKFHESIDEMEKLCKFHENPTKILCGLYCLKKNLQTFNLKWLPFPY